MKNFIQKICLLVFAGAILFASQSFAAGKVKEYTSPAGFKIWAVEDDYLPIVSLKIYFTKSGAAYDPENKQGLANMASDIMVEGAGGISGIEYMKKLEALASSLSFTVDSDNFYVSLTCLKENLDESVRLLALALTSANYSPDAIERVRKNILTNILRSEESAESKASKVFRQNYFGLHPYSRDGEGLAATVKSITASDLKSYAASRFAKNNIYIGVAGNITEAEITKILDKYLSKLPAKTTGDKEIPEFIAIAKSRVIRVEKDVPQSVIIFGMPGPKRLDPEFYPAYVSNYIIGGGGFESRLMHEVREKRGLVYSINSSLENYQRAALIVGHAATKNSSVDESLKVINEEIKKLHDSGASTAELSDSKDYLIGSFPLRLTQNASLADFVTGMQYNNLGIDFLERRNDYVKAVDLKQVNEVSAKYFDINKMLVVVVGKSK